MNTAWRVERWRIGLVAAASLAIGWLSGHWVLAIVGMALGYTLWNLYQAYQLEKWLSSGAKPSKAPNAGGVWAVIVQLIYRREKSEKKRKKRYKDLLNRINTAIAALPDAAVVLNAAKRIEWANDGAKTLLGIDKKRDAETLISNLIRDPAFTEYLNDPDPKKELEIASPLNHKKNISIRLTPFGKKQFLMTVSDISQRVELNRVRKAFIANASHELRTPLTVIAGYLEILKTAPELPETLLTPVNSALDQATRMENIIADLLILSRLESSRLQQALGGHVCVSSLIERIVNDLEQTVARGTHHFHLDLDDKLIINAIEMEVEGVVLNLCRNAVLHTPDDTDIFVSWQKDSSGNATLRVRDNGEGIPEEHLSRLTERFYRVDEGRSRSASGTGLGLSISRHVMDRYEGDLIITSKVGSFAQFEARFPPQSIVNQYV